MKRTLSILVMLLLTLGCASFSAAQTTPEDIKAFCIDFNWGEGGPNGFAKPGLWTDADPAQHVA